MLDWEDTRLAKIAMSRYGVAQSVVDEALARLEKARRAARPTCVLSELHALGALTGDQVVALVRVRDRGRPAGLKLVRRLGKGSAGTVYAGRDAEGRELAVKVLADGGGREHRRRAVELRALERLDHPSIPHVHGFGEVDGRLFHVMDLAPGESLGDLAARRGKLPWRLVVEIGIATARALQHVHERDLVHRDVKPSNVVVSPEGVTLVDFGLACEPGATATNGRAVGTAGYMSPELARGERATVACDVYSLGATLYFALTGRYVHAGENARELIERAGDPTRAARPLRAIRDDLPSGLIALVDRCLERDPALRFASMEELARALERVFANPVAMPRRSVRVAWPTLALAERARRARRRLRMAALA